MCRSQAMNRLRALTILAVSVSLIFVATSPVLAAKFDMGSAGLPTITGSVGGSVTGSSTLLASLVVTVNFGELSPVNSNQIVEVVIPIAMRSDSPYKIAVTISGTAFPSLRITEKSLCPIHSIPSNRRCPESIWRGRIASTQHSRSSTRSSPL